jgi:predicted DNA-binding protein
MKNPKRIPTLVHTLSVRFEDDTYMRLVAASKRERRTLSDYVRLLVEARDREQQHAERVLRELDRLDQHPAKSTVGRS